MPKTMPRKSKVTANHPPRSWTIPTTNNHHHTTRRLRQQHHPKRRRHPAPCSEYLNPTCRMMIVALFPTSTMANHVTQRMIGTPYWDWTTPRPHPLPCLEIKRANQDHRQDAIKRTIGMHYWDWMTPRRPHPLPCLEIKSVVPLESLGVNQNHHHGTKKVIGMPYWDWMMVRPRHRHCLELIIREEMTMRNHQDQHSFVPLESLVLNQNHQ
mmetsp:Transcript_24957/g.61413  ORF Transcript_24957/g.61413 Transcript_24957/m.61413 type:complete len:211 (+) Transcript_24957:1399-2031(+)